MKIIYDNIIFSLQKAGGISAYWSELLKRADEKNSTFYGKNSTNIFEDKTKDTDFLEYKNKILTQIPIMQKHKSELNSIYINNLPKDIFLGEEFNNWRFSILVDNKEKILDDIFKIEGLFASSHYPQVDYNYSSNPIKNSNAQKIHNRIINLFNDFKFNKEKAHKVADIINNNLIKV